GDAEWERQIELAGDEAEHRRRAILDDGPFNTVEIGASLFPILWISFELDVLVRLVLDEFERTGADRVLSHVLGRDVTRVNRRVARGQEGDKSRLRPLQVEGYRLALGADPVQVAVPGFARIGAQLVRTRAEDQFPGAFDVRGS